jgi:predicted PolB exonuclease-like 3'-5' exonuclease
VIPGNVLAYAIETVPDVEFGRRLHRLEGLSDKQVGYVMQTRRREETGSEFLSLEQHRVVAISVALRDREGFRAWSLGEAGSGEAELVAAFFDAVERHAPTLVSWDGGGFDLPVLNYRALRHRVQARPNRETGDDEPAFDRDRHPGRHIDLMDVLSGYRGRSRVQLDSVTQLLGLPGKPGMTGEQVWAAHLEGRTEAICDHCETEAVNTYLVYLRFELLRGRLGPAEHDRECALVREFLRRSGKPHLREFADGWPSAGA